jgi:hypothetical protein
MKKIYLKKDSGKKKSLVFTTSVYEYDGQLSAVHSSSFWKKEKIMNVFLVSSLFHQDYGY